METLENLEGLNNVGIWECRENLESLHTLEDLQNMDNLEYLETINSLENLEDVNRADSKNFTVCSKLESPENQANVDSKDFRENGDFRELKRSR